MDDERDKMVIGEARIVEMEYGGVEGLFAITDETFDEEDRFFIDMANPNARWVGFVNSEPGRGHLVLGMLETNEHGLKSWDTVRGRVREKGSEFFDVTEVIQRI